MLSSKLTRWSGLAAFIGGILFVFSDITQSLVFGDQPESAAAATDTWIILDMFFLVAIMLILMGLAGLYACQAVHVGIFGLFAFIVALSGTAMLFGFVWTGTFILPHLASAAPEFVDPGFLDAAPSGTLMLGVILTFGLFVIGWVLFGLSSLRARVLPRGASVLLMIGAMLFFVLFMVEIPGATVLISAALAWMGYSLWSGAIEQAAETLPAA